MKIFKLNYWVAILLCSLAVVCQSAEKYNLYSAQVPVENQEASARDQAIQQAFSQVLVKLTGDTKAIAQLNKPTPAQTSVWVQQFHYEGNTLVIQFDQKAIDDFLKKNNVAIWGGERPLTLVWMAVEENGTQAIVGEYEMTLAHWQQLFMTDARARGVPVLFPLLDLTDQQQVELNDVWYHVGDALKPAATRYQADNTLSARIFKNPQTTHWVGDFALMLQSDQVNWQLEASTPETLIKDTVARLANEFANRADKTVMSTQTQNMVLNIDNIKDASSYLRVLAFLQSLDALDSIAPIKITPNMVSFRVKLAAPLSLLEQQLGMGQLLQPLPSTEENILHYQFNA